jgi:hypothetical protein
MDAFVLRAMPTSPVAVVMLCLAMAGQATADGTDDAEDHVVAPRFVDTRLHSVDLPARLSLRLAVPETEHRSESWSRVDVAHEITSLDTRERLTLDFSLAAFQEDRPDSHAREADRLNRVGLFVGATTKDSHTHATIGLEYERRLSDLIGIGAVAEGSPAGREFVGAVPVFFHPVGGLALSIGPGFSVEDGHAHFLVRFGVGWDFELPAGLSLAPALSYDLTSGTDDAIVYGLMLSYAF